MQKLVQVINDGEINEHHIMDFKNFTVCAISVARMDYDVSSGGFD
jgi:hypothetical protein